MTLRTMDQEKNSINLLSLSILELLTLQVIERSSESMIRSDLYRTVIENANRFTADDTSSLPMPTFYSTLEKLKKQGLLEYKKIGGRNYVVNAEHGNQVINDATVLSLLAGRDLFSINDVMFQQLQSQITIRPKSMLIIKLLSRTDAVSMQLFASLAEKSYLLASDEIYTQYIQEGLEGVKQTEVRDKILQADNTFDAILLLNINLKSNSFGIDFTELLAEIKRVLTVDGTLIFTAYQMFEDYDNIFISGYQQLLEASGHFHSITKDELTAVLQGNGFTITFLTVNRGFILGIASLLQ